MEDVVGGYLVMDAVLPILKLLCVAAFGFILSHPMVQLISKPTLRLLSKLLFFLFLPCLIFTRLGASATFHNLTRWWFIPVNVLISTALGCLLGYLVAFLCKPPSEFFRFTIVATALGNTGNIPYTVVSSVCRSSDSPFGDSSNCSTEGVAYVSFSQWVSVILICTLVYHMMEPPLEVYERLGGDGEDEQREEIQELAEENESGVRTRSGSDMNMSKPLLVEAEWPGIEEKETEHCKTPFIARLFNSIIYRSSAQPHMPDLESTNPSSPKSIRCLAAPKVVRKITVLVEHTPLRHILQPPLIASMLAIIVAVIPPLKALIFGSAAPLAFITNSLEIVSEAMVPSAVLVLGGMLVEAPNGSRLGVATTVGITVARLVILPLIGVGVVWLADKWGLLISGNQLYRFVLLLQYTAPSAILLGAVANLRGYAVSEASTLLFWQHIFALLSLSALFSTSSSLFPTPDLTIRQRI